MHLHLSLFEGDTNAFWEPGSQGELSKVGQQFVAGLLRHAPEITAVTNQWVNSYKRLVTGYDAPVWISWARNNQSALVRRSEEHTSELQSRPHLVCRLLLEKKKKNKKDNKDPR